MVINNYLKPLTEARYLQKRVEAMLGKYYTIKTIDGHEIFIKASVTQNIRDEEFKALIEHTRSYDQRFMYFEININRKVIRAVHVGDMGGKVGDVPISETYYETPFKDMRIREEI